MEQADKDVLRKLQNTHYEMISALCEKNWEKCEAAINTHYDLIDAQWGNETVSKL